MQHKMPPHPPRYLPALDGLRGIAILMVTMWHFIPALLKIFPAWAGVDLFFVLSGYLITGRLLDSRNQPGYFSRFYRNRALRILPLYYALVIPFLAAIPLFAQEKNLPVLAIYKDHWFSFLIFTQNWTFIIFGRPRDLTLLPLWSLAVEEQFYLLWPLLIFLVPKARVLRNIFIGCILLVLLVRSGFYLYHPGSGDDIYYNTFFRMDGLVAGALLCQLHRSGIKIDSRWIKGVALALLAICLACCIAIGNTLHYNAFFPTAGYTVLALFFACVLHLVAQPGGVLARFCNLAFLRFCGKISYSLYLIQVPVMLLIGNRLYELGHHRWPGHTQLFTWAVPAICVLLSFLFSMASYRYFESFFLRMKTKQAGSSKLKINKGLAAEHTE